MIQIMSYCHEKQISSLLHIHIHPSKCMLLWQDIVILHQLYVVFKQRNQVGPHQSRQYKNLSLSVENEIQGKWIREITI